MANDTLTPKRAQPCGPMPLDRMDNMLERIYNGYLSDSDVFRRAVSKIPRNNIHWKTLRHLRIIGDADTVRLEHFESAGLSRGFYLNTDESWLLVILQEKPQLEDLFSSCGKYQYLESLSIWNSKMYARDWNELASLKALHLVDNPLLDTTEGIGKLTRLSKLFITNCDRLTQIQELEKLTSLKELSVTNCRQLTALPGLENLKQLTKLDLSECSSLTALPELQNLKQLTDLYLFECRSLTALPELQNLKQLTRLTLSECRSLTALSGLESLEQLTDLRLWGCRSLTALSGLKNLKQLIRLDLMGCHSLTALPEGLRHCQNLRYLDLSHLRLGDLPDWLPEIAENFTTDWKWTSGQNRAAVYLKNTTVDTIPDMSIFDQPYEMVVEWFENRRLNTVRQLNEIKVVFLGDGEAGKSHTIARLMNNGGEPKGYVNVRTPGIVIKDLHYPLGERDATLHLWDFGGQDILHSMHRIFLTERTFYVVLVDGSIGNQDERARYWLENIQSFAKDAPVLLVLNKLDDGLQADVNAVDLHEKFKGLKRIVKLSALQYSRERFNQVFRDALLEEIEATEYLDAKWPASWIQVKHALEQMDTHYIRGNDYLRICREAHVDKGQKPLLHWFHDLGISFCHFDAENEALEDYVVLKPNWITNALYIILFNEREGSNGGLVPIHTIRQMLGLDAPNRDAIKRVIPDAYYVGYDVNYVLDVFHAFKLSFESDASHEFFPMLADINAKPVAKEYADTVDCLEFNMVFSYLPNNLLHRLMVERHQELDMENVWRTGARFRLPGTDLSAVVTIDERVLHIFIRNDGDIHMPNTYLAMLKANVDKIVQKMGIKKPTCELVYKIHGKRAAFSYDRLLKLHARGRREEYCEALDEDFLITDILNQSAPAASADLNTLLDGMISACLHLQGNKNYRGWDENGRNSVIRDSLGDKGYVVLDQTLRGLSETGKSYGELDLLIQRVPNRPWVLCEALIAKGYTHEWNDHLDKLLNEYNPHGLPALFLLTYVDCDKSNFDSIWTKYKQHICDDDPKGFVRMPETLSLDCSGEYDHIKIARCTCRRNSYTPIVYHFFVQMDPKPPEN